MCRHVVYGGTCSFCESFTITIYTIITLYSNFSNSRWSTHFSRYYLLPHSFTVTGWHHHFGKYLTSSRPSQPCGSETRVGPDSAVNGNKMNYNVTSGPRWALQSESCRAADNTPSRRYLLYTRTKQ